MVRRWEGEGWFREGEKYVTIKYQSISFYSSTSPYQSTSIAHRIKNSSTMNESGYSDYIFSNLYITHNSYGPWVNCKRSFSAHRKDAFGALASLCSQSLVFNFCSQIIVAKITSTQCFIKSCLLKKSSIHISVNRISILGVLMWILLIIM